MALTYKDGSLSFPAFDMEFVTASDTVNFTKGICRGLLVGTAGDARLILGEGTDTGATNLVPLQQGYNPIICSRVFATGLTAANIWAIY